VTTELRTFFLTRMAFTGTSVLSRSQQSHDPKPISTIFARSINSFRTKKPIQRQVLSIISFYCLLEERHSVPSFLTDCRISQGLFQKYKMSKLDHLFLLLTITEKKHMAYLCLEKNSGQMSVALIAGYVEEHGYSSFG
jgi:hypothetical protein